MYKPTYHTLSKRGYITLLALLVSIITFAQGITVKGVVIDETDIPLIGATVQVKGGQAGAATDLDGNFTLTVNKNATLVVSYIGYLTQEVKVQGKNQLTIKLVPDSKTLDEVVVVGYGTMKKSDLTGSVSSVSAKDVEGFQTSSIAGALGGQIAGVQITSTDGTPGAGFNISIRGVGTLTGDASPLYIVDGFEVSDIDYLSNSDIESIQVLKDAAATSLYGSKGAYGVILIETKRGETAKPKVSYSANFVVKTPPRLRDVLAGGAERALRIMQILGNDTSAYHGYNEIHKLQALSDSLNPYYNNNTDWQGVFYQTTYNQTHNLSFSGKPNEKFDYKINANYYTEKEL